MPCNDIVCAMAGFVWIKAFYFQPPAKSFLQVMLPMLWKLNNIDCLANVIYRKTTHSMQSQ